MKKKLTLLVLAASFVFLLTLPIQSQGPGHAVQLNDQVGGA